MKLDFGGLRKKRFQRPFLLAGGVRRKLGPSDQYACGGGAAQGRLGVYRKKPIGSEADSHLIHRNS